MGGILTESVLQTSKIVEPIPMISGGMYARPHEFPYQIHLKYEDSFTCGGSILSTLFILTAAHCVKSTAPSSLKVVAGDHNRLIDEGTEQIRNVSHIFNHPNYITYDFDIAILALSEPLIFNEYVRNISYPSSITEFTGIGTVTGWGRTESTSSASNVLRKLELPIIPKKECRRKINDLSENMLCAGEEPYYYKGFCQGDSGGPLVCRLGGSSEIVVCGIVSYRFGTCGGFGYRPYVFTDVSRFSGWIYDTIQKHRLLRIKCSRSLFYCPDDNTCISRNKICDNKRDCSDGLDEKTCGGSFIETPATHFRCNNGKSIIASWVCDYEDDCRDNSDEDKCDFSGLNGKCNSDEITCKKDGRCIPSSCKCDNQLDCDDGSDEVDCFVVCNKDKQYRCSLKECIPLLLRCNGKKDCQNGEDEVNCFNTTVASTPRPIEVNTPIPCIIRRTPSLLSISLLSLSIFLSGVVICGSIIEHFVKPNVPRPDQV